MASITEAGVDRGASTEASAPTQSATDWENSATRTDIALLVAALFLQRFTIPYHDTFVHLDLLSIGIILLYQFLRGKLLIQYDRLLWFVLFAFVTTCSLLSNFKGDMLTGYLQFTVFYSLFVLSRRSSSNQYMKTLQAFQFLVMVLSCLAVVQFLGQFVVNGTALMNFFGLIPHFLFGDGATGWHDPRTFGNGIIKSNALFLAEPSALSQVTALGMLIEVLVFGRPKYLLVMALGFLMAYSGTGLFLLCFLPLAGFRRGKASLLILLVIAFVLGLIASGIVDFSAFTSRAGEFDTRGSSGYSRFISPFWLAARQFATVPLAQLLIGSGPGTIKYFASEWVNVWYTGGYAAEWTKILYEYGVIGTLIFICFLTSGLRRSKCPGLVVAAIIFAYVFLQAGMMLAIPLCTLNRTKLRRRIDEPGRYGRWLAAASGAG